MKLSCFHRKFVSSELFSRIEMSETRKVYIIYKQLSNIFNIHACFIVVFVECSKKSSSEGEKR